MKKKVIILLFSVCMAVSTGCSSKKTATGNEQLSDAVYNDDSISLAEYKGLKAEKKIYRVTEQSVENGIQEQLEEYADYKSVERSSEKGDNVYVDYTASVDGNIVDEEKNYYFTIGDEEFGEEFDERLTGVSKDDKLNFTINFDKDFSFEDFAGQAVQFQVSIREVQVEVMPEVTDEFIKENLGYDTYEQFTNAVKESVKKEYDTESTDELQENLLKQVIDASSILEYSQEEYEEASETVNSFYTEYADMFNQDIETIYDTFDVTEDSLEDEITDELYRMLVVRAIIKNEDLSLSKEEYEDGIVYYMEQNDYTSKEEFVNDYGEEEIRNRLLEDKVLKLLEENAEITEVEAEYDDMEA